MTEFPQFSLENLQSLFRAHKKSKRYRTIEVSEEVWGSYSLSNTIGHLLNDKSRILETLLCLCILDPKIIVSK